jgi:hypothetical protein
MAKDRQKSATDRHRHDTPEPRSLPPETGLIDASWDDDVDRVEGDPNRLFDRVTKVPTNPPDVRRMLAAADARDAERGGSDARDPHAVELGAPRVPLFHDSLPELPKEPPPPARVAEHRTLSESGLPLHGSRRADDAARAQDDSRQGRRTRPEVPQSRPSAPKTEELDELTLELMAPSEPRIEIDMPESAPRASPAPEPISSAQLAPMYADMKDRYAMGDFTGALVIADSILEVDAEDPEARRYAESCRNVLTQMYSARLGSLNQVVNVAIPVDQIRWLSLDHRAGFLLSLVDGISTVEELLDISGMTRLEALRIMYTLLEQRVISVESVR